MPTAYTSLLGLALPVTGELSGTWGDTVNNAITSLLDTAIAGTTTLSTDADVTLTTTTGASNQARQAILLCNGARTAARNITAPATSKTYVVINSTTGGFGVVIRGAGPTTGVTIANGERAVVAWNGSDFVKISGFGGSASFTDLTVTGPITLTNNLGFTSTQQRITGDMSSGTAINRLAFQTSTTNGNSTLSLLPNGTATAALLAAFNNSDPTNGSYVGLFVSASEARLMSARLGTGTFLPLTFYTNGSEQGRIETNGNWLVATTSTGADGLGIRNTLNLTFPEGSGTSYANVFRQASSAATILANGYKWSNTASGFASSIGTSWAKTAIGLGVGTGDITFYADPAGTVANGTDVTPTERLRVKSTGQTRFLPLAADPSGAENGDVYYNSTSNKLRVRAGGVWVDLH